MSISPPAGAEEEVKWTVAFFALVPLALGAMLQPCGRVLDLQAKYSFWLRCSPIIAIADSVHWVFTLFVHVIIRPRAGHRMDVWRRNLHAHLKHRFRSVDGNDLDLPRGRPELETPVRWILLCLSGIPFQTVKLASMQGIPWTKAFALMYCISILIGEVQYLSATIILRHEVPDRATTIYNCNWASNALVGTQYLSVSGHTFLVVHTVSRIAVALAALLDPWLYLGILLMSFAGGGLSLIATRDYFRSLEQSSAEDTLSLLLTGVCPAMILETVSVLGWVFADDIQDTPIPNTVLSIFFFPIAAIFIGLSNASLLAPLAIASACFRSLIRDAFACLLRFGSLYTLLSAILYYGLVYDPTGTINPRWTWVFG